MARSHRSLRGEPNPAGQPVPPQPQGVGVRVQTALWFPGQKSSQNKQRPRVGQEYVRPHQMHHSQEGCPCIALRLAEDPLTGALPYAHHAYYAATSSHYNKCSIMQHPRDKTAMRVSNARVRLSTSLKPQSKCQKPSLPHQELAVQGLSVLLRNPRARVDFRAMPRAQCFRTQCWVTDREWSFVQNQIRTSRPRTNLSGRKGPRKPEASAVAAQLPVAQTDPCASRTF